MKKIIKYVVIVVLAVAGLVVASNQASTVEASVSRQFDQVFASKGAEAEHGFNRVVSVKKLGRRQYLIRFDNGLKIKTRLHLRKGSSVQIKVYKFHRVYGEFQEIDYYTFINGILANVKRTAIC